jgi:hypothetical protein
MCFEAPLPSDLAEVIELLRGESKDGTYDR